MGKNSWKIRTLSFLRLLSDVEALKAFECESRREFQGTWRFLNATFEISCGKNTVVRCSHWRCVMCIPSSISASFAGISESPLGILLTNVWTDRLISRCVCWCHWLLGSSTPVSTKLLANVWRFCWFTCPALKALQANRSANGQNMTKCWERMVTL